MAAAMCQALASFYSDYKEKLVIISVSGDFYERHRVTHHICVSTHNSYCSFENCKFHIPLIGSSFIKFYQIIDCLYTPYKNRFYSIVISSTGEVFNQLDRAVHCNLKWKRAEKCPALQRKDCYAKNSNVIIYVLTRN